MMKKKIFSPLLALMICIISVLPVFALTERPLHIIDESDVFTNDEFNELEALAADIESKYGYWVMYCVTDQAQEGQTYEYCKALFEKNALTPNGIVLTHNTATKKYAIYVSDEAEAVITDGIEKTLLEAYNETESYYDGVVAYLEIADSVLKTSGVSASSANANAEVTVDPDLPTERLLPLVVDQANILTDEEETELIARLTEISDRFGLDLAVATVTDFGGKTPEAFADDFYDYNGYGRGGNADGALLVFKPGKQGERRLQLSTCGKAIDAFSDSDISYLIEGMKDYIINEDYIGAFLTFADKSEAELEAEFEPSVSFLWIPLSLAIGFVIAFAIMKSKTRSLKSVRNKVDAGDYASGVAITGRSDVFLYRNVEKTPIPRDSGSGGSGGGSTHMSSSGRTHGGGGASF